jgi:DNA-binding NarL/FixJ family response regulator
MASPIKVAIVEDDEGLRESLAVLINGSSGFRCVGTYGAAEEALEQLPAKNPDVVIMDITLPNLSGIGCVQRLKAILPKTQVLMLTMHEDADRIFDSLAAGASGYLLKLTPPAELLKAVEEVYRGASPMSGKIARVVVEYFQKRKGNALAEQNLSPRENEILGLLAKGFRYKEIADALSISIETVRTHVGNIYEKLHVHSRTEAVVKFLNSKPHFPSA